MKIVSAEYAQRSNRCKRGLYKEGNEIYHADAVRAFNILKKYRLEQGEEEKMSVSGQQ